MDPVDPVTLLRHLGGVSDGATLRRGCDPEALRRAVRGGRVLHLGRNGYALPGADEAIAAAARLHGAASHLSAARAWGWKVKHLPASPVVTVPRNRKVRDARRDGVDVRWAQLSPTDVVAHRTTRLRTVVDCARSLPFDEALCVADSALREGRVTHADLLETAGRSPRTGRAAALRVARLADGRAANPFESCLRAIVLDEADSYEFHALREAFTYDIRRYTAMVRAGWTVLRFCWEDVMQRPHLVRDTLTDVAALQRRAVRPCGDCTAA